MLSRIKNYLIQPYPHDPEIKRKWIVVLGIGLFVVIFIRFFGLADREGVSNILIILGFGVITVLFMTLNWIILPLLIPRLFHEDKWNVAKEIIFHVWNVFLIGLGNLLFANIGGYYQINLASIIQAQVTTLMVGIFPVTFIVMFKQNRLLKKYVNGARELNDTIQSDRLNPENKDILKQPISLSSESGRDPIQINLKNLLLVKSVNNYVEVYWESSQGIQKDLLRSSLKRIEDNLKFYSSIFRCHRTYLVNMKHIDQIKGNSQGYKLTIKGFENTIPVARTYSKAFREFVTQPK